MTSTYYQKFTDDQIKRIYTLKNQGLTNGQISKRIGCGEHYVSNVLHGKIRRIPGYVYPHPKCRSSSSINKSHQRRLTDGDISSIYNAKSEGQSNTQIASSVGCTRKYVEDLLKGKYRKLEGHVYPHPQLS